MKRWTLLFMLLLMPAVGQAQVSDHVIDLPETSSKWFLTVVYSSKENPSARDQQLATIIRSDPNLVRLVNQVVFTEWDDEDPFVRKSDWSAYLGTSRPALLLQTPADQDGTGTVVYFASGPHLKTDRNLARSISVAVKSYVSYSNRDCPRCPVRPTPIPVQPPPQVEPIPVIVPDIDPVPPPQPAKEETPLLLLLIPLLGGLAGLYKAMKAEASGL